MPFSQVKVSERCNKRTRTKEKIVYPECVEAPEGPTKTTIAAATAYELTVALCLLAELLHQLGTVVRLQTLHSHRTVLEEAQHVLQQTPVFPIVRVAEPASHQLPAAAAVETAQQTEYQ